MSTVKLLIHTPVTYCRPGQLHSFGQAGERDCEGEARECDQSVSCSFPTLQIQNEAFASQYSLSSIWRCNSPRYYTKLPKTICSPVTTKVWKRRRYDWYARSKNYLLFYCVCVVCVALVLAISFCGYQSLTLAIFEKSDAEHYDIVGDCKCVETWPKNYKWHQKWVIQNLTDACVEKQSQAYTFMTETDSDWVDEGQLKPCWTNQDCSAVFISQTNNPLMMQATWLYIGAMFIFIFALCVLATSVSVLMYLKKRLNLNDVAWIGLRDKNMVYLQDWNDMTGAQRFDYVVGYWSRTELSEQHKLNRDVQLTLLQFYDGGGKT